MINTDAIATLIRENIPDIARIYLFGSTAQGLARDDSDIDLSFYTNKPHQLTKVTIWEVAQKLAKLTGRDVDLIDFRKADTIFQHQILTTGKSIYSSNRLDTKMYETAVLSEYFNVCDLRKPFVERLKNEGI